MKFTTTLATLLSLTPSALAKGKKLDSKKFQNDIKTKK